MVKRKLSRTAGVPTPAVLLGLVVGREGVRGCLGRREDGRLGAAVDGVLMLEMEP